MDVASTLSWPLLLGLLTLTVSSQTYLESNPLLTGHYRHEITYHPTQWASFPQHTSYLNQPANVGFRSQARQPSFVPPILQSRNFFDVAGNSFDKPAPTAASLFTPNTVQQPAETPGQYENYRKALEEEAREADKAENDINTTISHIIDADLNAGTPKSYVDVRVGGAKNYNYGYVV